MFSTIVRAIANSTTITVVYEKPNGVVTVRLFAPYSVTRCANGNTTINGQCPHDGHPKSLSLSGIRAAHSGDFVSALVGLMA